MGAEKEIVFVGENTRLSFVSSADIIVFHNGITISYYFFFLFSRSPSRPPRFGLFVALEKYCPKWENQGTKI